MLVRRVSVGEVGIVGRSLSRLERPDWRRRGGGGGGGIFALSFETDLELGRFELIEDVRATPGLGEGGSEEIVVRREEGGLGDETVARRVVAADESSVEEELALEVLIVDRVAPWRLVGGGGGGAFWEGEDVTS